MLDALRIIDISNNLGDAKSLVTHPATTTHRRLTPQARADAGITDGVVRLVGRAGGRRRTCSTTSPEPSADGYGIPGSRISRIRSTLRSSSSTCRSTLSTLASQILEPAGMVREHAAVLELRLPQRLHRAQQPALHHAEGRQFRALRRPQPRLEVHALLERDQPAPQRRPTVPRLRHDRSLAASLSTSSDRAGRPVDDGTGVGAAGHSPPSRPRAVSTSTEPSASALRVASRSASLGGAGAACAPADPLASPSRRSRSSKRARAVG